MSGAVKGAASASLALDARALALLDRLLAATADDRAAELARLATTDAALHRRVEQLLSAGAATDASLLVAAPLAAGLQHAAGSGVVAGDLVAGWRLLRELGRGGMASVWLAERADGSLKRQVAIKLPIAARLGSVLGERFARERDMLAALDHAHIARLFDAGVAPGGQPFLVLEYVDGLPITDYAHHLGLSQRQRLALFGQVLAAVDHAHRHLTVHRDLKPSNILVTVDGQVKLLDFGIAKLLAPAEGPGPDLAALTQDAEALLTPRYAAPEQVLSRPVSTATDVYAAGVVLYELLTGTLPYAAGIAGIGEIMQAVLHDAPRAPGLSRDIDTVLLTALRKDPAERYASIERFAEDLRRVLADEPILARRVPWWQRLRLLLRRRRRASAAVALAGVVLLAVAGAGWQQYRESQAQRARGDAVRAFVYNMIADAEPAAGRSEVTGRELVDAAVARARVEFVDQPRLRGELLRELGRVYFRLQQVDASVAVLTEAVALLQAQAPPHDPDLNRARAELARSLMGADAARAAGLAEQALSQCTGGGQACAEVRAMALYALMSIDSWQGRAASALTRARAMTREANSAYPVDEPYLATYYEALAAAARNAGELGEAAAAVQRAVALARLGPMKAANRNRLDLLQAAVQNDLGLHAQARALLVELRGRDAPADERAMVLRALAVTELSLGRPEAALLASRQSLDVLGAGTKSANAWLSHEVWARAASLAGRHADAEEALAAVEAGFTSVFAPDSDVFRRIRRERGAALLRAGSDRPALDLLRRLHRDAEAAGSRPRETAMLLTVLGCAEALAGNAKVASGHYATSEALLAQSLPAGHPLLLRAQALRAMTDATAAAPAAVLRYRATLADDSPQRRLAADCRSVI